MSGTGNGSKDFTASDVHASNLNSVFEAISAIKVQFGKFSLVICFAANQRISFTQKQKPHSRNTFDQKQKPLK